jgi:hypothetical protein
MKSIVNSILILMTFSFLVFSCSNGSSPSNVLNQYLDETFNLEYEAAYSKLSGEDKSVKSIQEYLSENDKGEFGFLAKTIADKSSYKIIQIEKDKNKAKAIVELTIPDGEKIAGELMVSLFSKMFSDNLDEKEMASKMEEKYKDEELPMTTKTDTMNLVKDEDGWKVYLNWKAEKLKKEKEEKIKQLISEADELRKEKKLHGALDKYEQVLELDSKMVDAIEGKEETNNEIALFKEKQDYIENIQLYELKSKYHETYFDGKVPGVTFKLKNNGNRTLKRVEVTVYFKDSDGNIIFEEDYLPVLVSEYSFNDNKPLKPNYVWSLGDKFYKAEKVPSEWKVGSVSAKITDIEFE